MSIDKFSDWPDTPLDNTPSAINSWMLEGLKGVREILDIETGIISKIDDSNYAIQQVYSTMGAIFSPGDQFELRDTYCAAVVKHNKTITYIQVGSIPEMLLHPVYQAVQLETYIGTPIHNKKGNVAGTVNFSSHKIRTTEFSTEEIAIVEEMAKKISSVLYP